MLGRLEGWDDVLVPAARDLLRRADNFELRRVLAQTLEAWGASAAPAVPELRSLLDGDARLWAAAALGAIGPGYLGEIGAPAAGAAPLLEAALAGDLRLNYFGGWRAFAEDGERRRHLRRALDRIQDATAR